VSRHRIRYRRRTAGAYRLPPVGVCSACSLPSYPTRKDARVDGRANQPGEHLRAYLCPANTGYWHYGPLTGSAEPDPELTHGDTT
jgi:hypothetical protein